MATGTTTIMSYIEQGGPAIMWPLVIMFGLGVAILLWRLTVILIALFNTRSLFKKVSKALEDKDGGLAKALAICEKTPGPVATIVHAGLGRMHLGIGQVEKAIESAGTVEMAFLENGLVWLATISNLAPLLGFFGTVAGMIMAFKSIAAAGDVEPTVVATGISVALITTARSSCGNANTAWIQSLRISYRQDSGKHGGELHQTYR